MISHDQVELDRLKFHQVGFAKQDPGTPYQLDRNVQTLYNSLMRVVGIYIYD